MPIPTPTPCQDTFNHLASKYWEVLQSMGIGNLWESHVSNASGLIQRMQSYIPSNTSFHSNIRDFYDETAWTDDKRRKEIILDYLGNSIRNSLSEDDLRLSNNSRCNFLGDDINDISDWGKENGPHDGSDNVDDFLKHNFPFLKPPPRISSLPSPFTFGSFSASDFPLPDATTQPPVNSGAMNQNDTNNNGTTFNPVDNPGLSMVGNVMFQQFGQPQQPTEGGRRKSRKKRKPHRKIPFLKKVRKSKRHRTTKKKRTTKRRRTKKQKGGGGGFGPDGPLRIQNASRQQNLTDARHFVQFLKTPLALEEYKLVAPEGGPNIDKIDEALLRWWKKLGEDQDDKNTHPHGVMHLFNDWVKTVDNPVTIPWYDYYVEQHYKTFSASTYPQTYSNFSDVEAEIMRRPSFSSDEEASYAASDTSTNSTEFEESFEQRQREIDRAVAEMDPEERERYDEILRELNTGTYTSIEDRNDDGTTFNPVDNSGLSMVGDVMFQQFGQPQQPMEGGRRKSRKKRKPHRKIPFSKKVRKSKRRRTTKKKRTTKRQRTKKNKKLT